MLLEDLATGQRHTIGDSCLIGRTDEADLRFDSPRISRRHARIDREGSNYLLYDLRSANGTSLNGRNVSQPATLVDGDRIDVAGNLLVFHTSPGHVAQPSYNLDNPATVTLISVQKTPTTFLVSDLHDFTPISGKFTEEQLATVVGGWAEACRDLLEPLGGVLDKFIGDCVYAYWRTTDIDTRARVLETAEKIHASLADVAEQHAELLGRHSIELKCGVGLHIGSAAIGTVVRGNPTAMGEAVNLTFRLESLTRELDERTLATREFLTDWPEIETQFHSYGERMLKGINRPIEVLAYKPV